MDRDRIRDYLSSHHLFGVLPQEVLNDLVRDVMERTYPKGHHLCHVGDPASQVFIVETGLVALTELDEHGETHVVLTFSPGDVFGSASTALGLRRAYTALAVTETTALLIDREWFDRLYHEFPQFTHQVVRELYWILRRTQQIIVRLTRAPIAARVAAFLLDSMDDPGSAEAEARGFDLPLSHQDIALLLGTSRETITRVLVRLSRSGTITIESRRVVVLKPNELRRIAQG